MANRYWRGGSAIWNLINTTPWSDTSGGAGGFSVPTSADNVFFDLNSGVGNYTVTGTGISLPCKNCTITAPSGGNVTFETIGSIDCYGSMSMYSGTILDTDFLGFDFKGTSLETVDFGGVIQRNVTFSGTGSYTLLSDLETDGTVGITHTAGTLTTDGFNIESIALNSTGIALRTLDIDSSTITLTSTDATVPWNLTGSNLTFNAGSSTIKLVSNDTDSNTRIFNGLSKTYDVLWLSGTNTNASFTITGSNTFNDITEDFASARTILFTASTTQTTSDWNIIGSLGNIISIESTSPGAPFNLVKSGPSLILSDYLAIEDSAASPANKWYAGDHSTNVGGSSTGWVFKKKKPVIIFY